MERHSAEQAVLASSIVTAGVWGYRKLVEPTASTTATSSPVKQLLGLEPTPAPASQFLVAFGFTYLALSLAVIAAPEIAGAFAILIATGAILTNGASVFNDISSQIGKPAASTTPAATTTTGQTTSSKGTAPVGTSGGAVSSVRVTMSGQLH